MTENGDLIAALAGAPAGSIGDVLAIVQGIGASLPDGDGLKWFNLLYRRVTQSVPASASSRGFEDSAWVGLRDVLFANLSTSPRPPPQ